MRTSRTIPHRRTTFLAALTALVLALAAALTVAGSGSARGDVPTAPGWNLQWSDDFNGANRALPSSANWQIDTGHGYPGGPGNWGTGEIQNYTASPDNVSLDGSGNLRITRSATARATGPPAASRPSGPTSRPRRAAPCASRAASRCRT